jgi:hypothetical protein
MDHRTAPKRTLAEGSSCSQFVLLTPAVLTK